MRFRPVGRFRGAGTPADYDMIVREADLLTRKVGLPMEVVPRAKQRRRILSDLYRFGVVFSTHGGLPPALCHAGLL